MSSPNEIDFKQIARGISMIENESAGFEKLLSKKMKAAAMVVGITGAPGSGKSTLTDALINEMVADKKRVAVLCVDPSSPFNRGAILGDRIRMSNWYNHPDVFIRSLASRGALGGLHPFIIEITEFVRYSGFDYVIVETVGVGQSEVDIAALADMTVVVLVPEGGDSIQSMKSGLMEIADIFVVNKSDRPGADVFYNHLMKMIGPVYRSRDDMKPVFKTIASEQNGVNRLYNYLSESTTHTNSANSKSLLLQKGIALLQSQLMKTINVEAFKNKLYQKMDAGTVDLFAFVREYLNEIKGNSET